MSKKNVLITGGAGFIGSGLAIKLLDLGYNVTVLDNLSPQIHGIAAETSSPLFNRIRGKVRFIKGSVTNIRDLRASLEGQHIVVHLAAETGTGQSMYEIQKYTDVNIGGTSLLLDLIVNNHLGIEKVVLASSRAIYGEGKYLSKELGVVFPHSRQEFHLSAGDFEVKYPECNSPLEVLPTDEDSKTHPTSVYGITKLTQEQMVMTVTKAIGIAGVAFRYQNVYGPFQSLSNPYTGILSIFSNRIINGKPINIFEDGKESRDFVFIDDVVNATVSGIEMEEANGKIFNVGSGIPVSVVAVAEELMKQYGRIVPAKVTGNYRVGDIRHNYADLTNISSRLGFKPEVSFHEGIARFTKWVIEQEKPQDEFDISINELKNKGLFK